LVAGIVAVAELYFLAKHMNAEDDGYDKKDSKNPSKDHQD